MADEYDSLAPEPLVLLVETDPDVADVTSQLLGIEGYNVEHASSVQRAQQYLNNLSKAGQDPPALTLLGDLRDEAQAIDFLKLLEAKSNMLPRVILFSALSRQILDEMALKIKAVGIVVKPFDTDDLIRIIRATIGPGSRTDQTQVLRNRSAPTPPSTTN